MIKHQTKYYWHYFVVFDKVKRDKWITKPTLQTVHLNLIVNRSTTYLVFQSSFVENLHFFVEEFDKFLLLVHSYFGDLFSCKANVHSKFYISREARAKFDDIICYITWSSARSKLELQPRMATFLFSSNYKASTNSNYRKALLYFDKHISLYSYLSIYSPVVRAYAYFF